MSTVVITFTGVVGMASDPHGYFGAAGAAITGDAFTSIWHFEVPYGSGHGVSGGLSSPFAPVSPLIGADLVINGHDVPFGQSGLYGIAMEGGFYDDLPHQSGTFIYVNSTDSLGPYALNNYIYSFSQLIPTLIEQPFSYTVNPATDNTATGSTGGIGGSVYLPGGTYGYLLPNSVSLALAPHSVPTPDLGTGWTSLFIIALMWGCYWHRRAMR